MEKKRGTETIIQYKKKISNLYQIVKNYQEKERQYEEYVEEINNDLISCRENEKRLQQVVQNKVKQLVHCQEKEKDLQQEVDDLKGNFDEIKSELGKKEQLIDQLQNKRRVYISEMEKLRSHTSDNSNTDAISKELEAMKEQRDELLRQLSTISDETKKQVENNNEYYKNTLNAKEDMIHILQDRENSYKHNIKHKEELIAKLKDSLQLKQSEIDSLKSELDSSRNNELNEQLRQQLHNKEQEMAEAISQKEVLLADMKQNDEIQKSELQKLAAEKNELLAEIFKQEKKQQAEIDSLNAVLKGNEAEHEAVSEKLELTQTELAEEKAKAKELSDLLESKDRLFEDIQQKEANQQAELSKLREALENKETEFTIVAAQIETMKTDGSWEEEREKLQNMVKEFKDKEEGYQRLIQDYESNFETLVKKMEDRDLLIAELREKIEGRFEEQATYKVELPSSRIIEDYKQLIEHQHSELGEYRKLIEMKEQWMQLLQGKLDSYEGENSSIEIASQSTETANEGAEDISQIIQNIRSEIKDYKNTLRLKEELIEKLQQKIYGEEDMDSYQHNTRTFRNPIAKIKPPYAGSHGERIELMGLGGQHTIKRSSSYDPNFMIQYRDGGSMGSSNQAPKFLRKHEVPFERR